ncbi:MAG: hypothetical protein K2I76_03885 [Malacoplasma sp.]|nr:hypothetical protein [Malacoplasma sp.]
MINYMDVWKKYFGNETKAVDVFGVLIYKNKYNSNENGSWTIDHIFPRSPHNDNAGYVRKGRNCLENLQPLSIFSNQKKGSFLGGKVNGVTFSVKIIHKDENGVIGQMMIKKGNKWYTIE